MKTLLITLAVILVLPCCTTNPDQLARLGNIALTAAEIGGGIQPAQARAIRSAGKLVLDAQSGQDVKLEDVSQQVVDYAVAQGRLTPEQAAALQKAGEVPITSTTATK